MKTSALLLLTLLVAVPAFGQTAQIIERHDLAYAVDVPDEKHRLDVYAPANGRNAPVLVFVHGGGWSRGDRTMYSYLGRSFAREGFVVVIPSYRLYPNASGQDMASDVADAIAWTVAHAPEYGGKQHSVILSGHSAGAHLAALVALDSQYLRAAHVPESDIAGVIPISGPDDLRRLVMPAVTAAFGKTPQERFEYSPLEHARAHAPPFEVICAQHDMGLLCDQGQALASALRTAGSSALFFSGEQDAHLGDHPDRLACR